MGPIKFLRKNSHGVLRGLVLRGEQDAADIGNGLLVAELQALVEGVGAHDFALAGVQLHSSEATLLFIVDVLLVEFGEVFHGVDLELERGLLALEHEDVLLHELLVLGTSFVEDTLDESLVALSADDVDLSLGKLDEALDDELLKEFLVAGLISLEVGGEAALSLVVGLLDELVNSGHLLDSLLVLGCRSVTGAGQWKHTLTFSS